MYQLIGSPVSRSFRVLWALEELSLDYDLVAVGPHDEKVLAINPSGKVPALVVDGEVVIDSIAIVQFLADKHQQLTYAAGTIERAKQDSFTQFIADDIDGNIWTAAKHTFIYPEHLRAKDAVKEAVKWDVARAVNALESRLGDSDYLVGDQFTVPDLLLAHCAGWAARAGFDVKGPKLDEYLQRIYQRPAFIKACEIREQHR